MNRMTGFVLSGIVTAAMMGSAMAASTAPATAPASSATTAAPMAATPTAAAPSQTPSAHQGSTRHASISRKEVEAVQGALKNNGEQVAVDGIWGHKTTSALEDYQKKHGIKPTGHADPATLQQLKVTSM